MIRWHIRTAYGAWSICDGRAMGTARARVSMIPTAKLTAGELRAARTGDPEVLDASGRGDARHAFAARRAELREIEAGVRPSTWVGTVRRRGARLLRRRRRAHTAEPDETEKCDETDHARTIRELLHAPAIRDRKVAARAWNATSASCCLVREGTEPA
jgi:hypothetical protein